MFKKNCVSLALPHILAVALFIVVSFVYFYPVLEGKVLRANDSTVSTINSREIRDYREKYGQEPLWTNSIFGGMPAFLISTRYPGNLLKHIDISLRIFKMPVSALVLSMSGFYLLLLIFGVDPWLSITGALAYGLSSFFFQILAAGHNTQAIALAYMAPLIGAIYYSYRKDVIRGVILTTFFLSLEIIANHPQITYYGIICLLLFGIFEFVSSVRKNKIKEFIRITFILFIPFIVAIAINFANLYSVYEYGKHSIRGKSDLKSENIVTTSGLSRDYITQWSYGIDETFNLIIPDFKGGSSKPFDRNSETFKVLRKNNAVAFANQIPAYWGTQPMTEGPHYLGAIVIFLFVLGLVIIKGPEKWWLLSATILSIVLAWGKNFMFFTNLFIDYFPGYNKFRAVTMILVIAQFSVPLLGFIALKNALSGTVNRNALLKGIKIAAGVTGGIILLILLFPGISGSFISQYETQLPDWLTNAMIADRKELLKNDAVRSFLLVTGATVVILGFVIGKLRREYTIVILTILIFIDLWPVDKRYLNSDNFEKRPVNNKVFTPATADKIILGDSSYHRVLNLTVSTFNDNSPTSYFHKSIGGYHGAKIRRYQEFIDSVLMRELIMFQTAAEKASSFEDIQQVLPRTFALNMLNTKYIIVNLDAPPVINPNALRNAWFVEKPLIVENANMELASVASSDPSKEAVIDMKFKSLIREMNYPVNENETIELVSYQPNKLIYKYSATSEKLAVFSEIYYPEGWKSYIDGREVPFFRTNYILRGMILAPGEHEIKFEFEPASYYLGNKISFAGSLLFFVMVAGFFITRFLQKRKGRYYDTSQ